MPVCLRPGDYVGLRQHAHAFAGAWSDNRESHAFKFELFVQVRLVSDSSAPPDIVLQERDSTIYPTVHASVRFAS